MNSIEQIQHAFTQYLKKLYSTINFSQDQCRLVLNVDEARQEHGNLSSNSALVLAKELHRVPRDIATEIASGFVHPLVEKIVIAGPGFINFYLTEKAFIVIAQELYEQKEAFFKSDTLSPRYNYSLEF